MSRKSSINKIKRDNSQSNNIAAGLVMDLYEKGHSPITTRFQGFGLSECDVLSVSKSDYIYEYEIKISKADFKKDFIKEKHQMIMEGKFVKQSNKGTWYNVPNYFYFVVPENLISMDDIPSYAGLIYLKKWIKYDKEYSCFEIIKKAPIIHKTKATTEFIRGVAHQLSCKVVFRKVE